MDNKIMGAVTRFFITEDNLYGVMEDGTIQRYDGDKWEVVPSRQIICPHCNKLLEPHICGE